MNREKIREKTMQLIYQMEAEGTFDVTKLSIMEEDANIIGKKQADDTFDAIRDHIGDIDELIKANLDKWSFERISKTDLAIIRTAVAEIKYLDYIPQAVSINEAVELSKKYSADNSYKFVNSVLGKIINNTEQVSE
ncbi:MAG: transcription antitermination factor NusB [Mogibacterium sp.]|nr:transcription antitermination factor NusB [Mogibacterium sp.]